MRSFLVFFIIGFSLSVSAGRKGVDQPKDYDSRAAEDVIHGPDGPQDDGIRWPDGDDYDVGGMFIEDCESALNDPDLF